MLLMLCIGILASILKGDILTGMPRKKVTVEGEVEALPVSAPRAPRPRAPRAPRTPRPKREEPAPEENVYVPRRQASNAPAAVGALLIVSMFVIGGAIYLGTSDKGEIDVNAAIRSANEANIAAGGDPSKNVALVREDLRAVPNGGLVPTDSPNTTPTPEPPQATTTATTTDTGASTTPEGTEATPEQSAEGSEAEQAVPVADEAQPEPAQAPAQ